MSGRRWYIADTHFWHENLISKFKKADGSPVREFESVEEMNGCIVERWNEVVGVEDTIVHLGDVSMRTTMKWLEILERCHGRKILIKGNHDLGKLREYMKWFEDIRAYEVKELPDGRRVVFSHMPVRMDGEKCPFDFNVHGHVHWNSIEDIRYLNVSCEVLGYRPIEWNELAEVLMRRGRDGKV